MKVTRARNVLSEI